MTRTRPVVVTGAGRGLGAALARHYAATGRDVALCARTAADLDRLASELRADHGVHVLTTAVDVTHEAGMRAFAAKVEGELGPAGAVINNAGILGPVGPVDQLDITAWRAAIDVNVVGAVTVTAAFVPQMDAAGGGAVVNLGGAGIGGNGTHANISAYTTSKGALVTLTEALAKELGPRRIRVNAIAPGGLNTGFMDPVLDAAPGLVDDSLRGVAEALRPPDDAASIALDANLAELMSFLISDESGWLTGKYLSARWESVESLTADRERVTSSSLFTLRRVDGTMFAEVERP